MLWCASTCSLDFTVALSAKFWPGMTWSPDLGSVGWLISACNFAQSIRSSLAHQKVDRARFLATLNESIALTKKPSRILQTVGHDGHGCQDSFQRWLRWKALFFLFDHVCFFEHAREQLKSMWPTVVFGIRGRFKAFVEISKEFVWFCSRFEGFCRRDLFIQDYQIPVHRDHLVSQWDSDWLCKGTLCRDQST